MSTEKPTQVNTSTKLWHCTTTLRRKFTCLELGATQRALAVVAGEEQAAEIIEVGGVEHVTRDAVQELDHGSDDGGVRGASVEMDALSLSEPEFGKLACGARVCETEARWHMCAVNLRQRRRVIEVATLADAILDLGGCCTVHSEHSAPVRSRVIMCSERGEWGAGGARSVDAVRKVDGAAFVAHILVDAARGFARLANQSVHGGIAIPEASSARTLRDLRGASGARGIWRARRDFLAGVEKPRLSLAI